jgi:O-antigen/teichoic acid export membrane protein
VSTTEPAVDHAKKREHSILAFFATSLASRGLGIGCQFLQVPIALRFLGNEAFGLWVTLSSLGFILSYSDFGIGLGVQNQVAESLGRGDNTRARQVFVTGLAFLVGVMGVLLAVLVPFCLLANVAGMLHIADPAVAASTRSAILVVTLVWCLNVPLGLGQRVAYGAQLGWMHNAAATCSQVLMLVATAVGAWAKVGMATFFVLTFAGSAVVNLIFLIYLLHRLRWLQMRRSDFHLPYLRELSGLGIYFFFQQIATMVLFTMPPLILSATMGAAAVTPFNLAQRVLNLFTVVTNAVLLPIWPAYAEAKAQSDWNWIRRTLIRSLLVVMAAAVVPMFLVAPFLPKVIHWWTKAAQLPSPSLIWLLVVWNALTVIQQPFGYLLAGISKVRRATLYSVLSTVTALIAIFVLIPHCGVNALPLGLIIGFVPFILSGNALETYFILRHALRGHGGSGSGVHDAVSAAAAIAIDPTDPAEQTLPG